MHVRPDVVGQHSKSAPRWDPLTAMLSDFVNSREYGDPDHTHDGTAAGSHGAA
jgi:hypothetical protein